jgi:hypothetical protein
MDAEARIEKIAQQLEAIGSLFSGQDELGGMSFILEGFAGELHEVAAEVRGKV